MKHRKRNAHKYAHANHIDGLSFMLLPCATRFHLKKKERMWCYLNHYYMFPKVEDNTCVDNKKHTDFVYKS